MMQPNRMQVRNLRKCDAHKNCVVASMESPQPKSKSKGAVPYSYTSADQHIPTSQLGSFLPGSKVDVHAVPVAKRPVKFSSPSNPGNSDAY